MRKKKKLPMSKIYKSKKKNKKITIKINLIIMKNTGQKMTKMIIKILNKKKKILKIKHKMIKQGRFKKQKKVNLMNQKTQVNRKNHNLRQKNNHKKKLLMNKLIQRNKKFNQIMKKLY